MEILKYILDNLGWYLFAAPFAFTGVFGIMVSFEDWKRKDTGARIFAFWAGLLCLWIVYCMVT